MPFFFYFVLRMFFFPCILIANLQMPQRRQTTSKQCICMSDSLIRKTQWMKLLYDKNVCRHHIAPINELLFFLTLTLSKKSLTDMFIIVVKLNCWNIFNGMIFLTVIMLHMSLHLYCIYFTVLHCVYSYIQMILTNILSISHFFPFAIRYLVIFYLWKVGMEK